MFIAIVTSKCFFSLHHSNLSAAQKSAFSISSLKGLRKEAMAWLSELNDKKSIQNSKFGVTHGATRKALPFFGPSIRKDFANIYAKKLQTFATFFSCSRCFNSNLAHFFKSTPKQIENELSGICICWQFWCRTLDVTAPSHPKRVRFRTNLQVFSVKTVSWCLRWSQPEQFVSTAFVKCA